MQRWISWVIYSVNVLNDVVNVIRKGGKCLQIVHSVSDEVHYLHRTDSSSIQYITKVQTVKKLE